jgi:hypothetical protein
MAWIWLALDWTTLPGDPADQEQGGPERTDILPTQNCKRALKEQMIPCLQVLLIAHYTRIVIHQETLAL